ncbi:hypothetical protein D9619_004465 [Psilocybe cf. subviscida]|uniref:IucC family-domain-containing protein n=1 Tax=Psilocybe cf. subviscida TaxID=2480587 RepID=A0A8H5BPT2_9AGAR|nr:hypothetical protein D9619_004465 [Psilocybe cf. subviscida]
MLVPTNADIQHRERANFATAARLLSCLVTESLVDAFFRPHQAHGSTGYAIILTGQSSEGDISLDKILAVVPLHHAPVAKPGTKECFRGRPIGLLDPLDMLPVIFETGPTPPTLDGKPSEYDALQSSIFNNINPVKPGKSVLYQSTDALSVWNKFAAGHNLDDSTRLDIAYELSSAIKWQAYSYANPPEAPAFSSPSIIWEQSIVEGHPTHPMHKTRRFLPPLPDYAPGQYDLLHPQLRFIAVPRENLKITYDFEVLTAPLLKAVASTAGKDLPIESDRVIIPIHELQVAHIQDKFPDAYVYSEEFSLPLMAQQSLRSVLVPSAYHGLHLKLGFGVKLTSAVRTISPESAYLGPRFSAQVVPALTMDRNIITVARELASVVHANPNGEIAKHCAALVRECHEDGSEERGERLIVCTSLVEKGHAGENGHLYSVIRAFELDTQEKRVEWLDKFASVFLKAFLPPMLHNGVAFECHPQNCVARFDLHTKELKGFIIRDFGGLRVHPETLKQTTGVEIDFLAGHSIIADTLDDVYTRMYHTIIHNHFQQLIRVLDLHYNGIGWETVRNQLHLNIPREHPLYDVWMSPERTTFPGKCFMRMRMSSMYRFHMHGPFPNLIHYRGNAESS